MMDWPSRHPAVFAELKKYNENLIKSLGSKIYEHTLDEESLAALHKARSASPAAVRQKRHLMAWFDAFRELKRIHEYRDNYYQDRPVYELLNIDRDSDIDLSESHFSPGSYLELSRANKAMRQAIFDNSLQGASVY